MKPRSELPLWEIRRLASVKVAVVLVNEFLVALEEVNKHIIGLGHDCDCSLVLDLPQVMRQVTKQVALVQFAQELNVGLLL